MGMLVYTRYIYVIGANALYRFLIRKKKIQTNKETNTQSKFIHKVIAVEITQKKFVKQNIKKFLINRRTLNFEKIKRKRNKLTLKENKKNKSVPYNF